MLNSYCILTGHMPNIDCVGMRLKEEYVCFLIDLKNLSLRVMSAVEAFSGSFVQRKFSRNNL